jgi:porin
VIVLPTKDPHAAVLNASVMQANGTASEPGFDELAVDNLTFAGEARVRTEFFGLTGHQLVSGTYSNRTYNELDQRLGFVLENQRLVQKSGSWNVGYNFDQYVYEPEKGAGRGVGVFGRFGASDGNPNLVHYFYSLGIGGKGMIDGRPDDRFGLGYYYAEITSPTFQRPVTTHSFLRDEWGFEAFYNLAITPWLELTPDLQVIGPAQKRSMQPKEHVATAVVLGFRLRLVL